MAQGSGCVGASKTLSRRNSTYNNQPHNKSTENNIGIMEFEASILGVHVDLCRISSARDGLIELWLVDISNCTSRREYLTYSTHVDGLKLNDQHLKLTQLSKHFADCAPMGTAILMCFLVSTRPEAFHFPRSPRSLYPIFQLPGQWIMGSRLPSYRHFAHYTSLVKPRYLARGY